MVKDFAAKLENKGKYKPKTEQNELFGGHGTNNINLNRSTLIIVNKLLLLVITKPLLMIRLLITLYLHGAMVVQYLNRVFWSVIRGDTCFNVLKIQKWWYIVRIN